MWQTPEMDRRFQAFPIEAVNMLCDFDRCHAVLSLPHVTDTFSCMEQLQSARHWGGCLGYIMNGTSFVHIGSSHVTEGDQLL